ncbi:MAG: hypothetical protein AB7O97_03350 [Planctomycetota bacterium]
MNAHHSIALAAGLCLAACTDPAARNDTRDAATATSQVMVRVHIVEASGGG